MNGLNKSNINKQILSLFSGQDATITIPRIYIKITGSYTKANVLNQCIFYSDKSILGEGWFWKSYEDWQEETDIEERTLRRIFTVFENENLIERRTQKIKGKRTLVVRPCIEKIQELIAQYLSQTDKMSEPKRTKCPDSQTDKMSVSIHTYNTADENKQINIPDSDKSGKNKKLKDYEKDERFMRFYGIYPQKQKPRDAWKAFKSIVGDDDDLLDYIVKDVEERKKRHTKWQDKQFIIFPAAYLRSGAFEGEIYNEAEEKKEKERIKKEENAKRLAEQERISKQRQEYEAKKHQQYNEDGQAYRKIAATVADNLKPRKTLAQMLAEKKE